MSNPDVVHIFRYRWPRLLIDLQHEEKPFEFYVRERPLSGSYIYHHGGWWYCTTRRPNGSTVDLVTNHIKAEDVPTEIRTWALLLT